MKISDRSWSHKIYYIFTYICMCIFGHDIQFISYCELRYRYILLHNNYFKTYLLKTIRTHSLTTSEGQEFRRNVAGWFSVRVLHKVAVKMSVRNCRVSFQDGSLTWLENWSWLLVEASGFPCVNLSVGLLECSWNVVLASPRGSKPKRARQKWQHLLWPSLRNHIPSLWPYLAGNTD